MTNPERRWVDSGTELERTVFFSDAVFAIAITLLVLDIRLPEVPEERLRTELPGLVLGLWPSFLSFAISFLVIGSYWMAHHRMFHYIRRYDGRLLWINLLFLMSIAFLPFPTSLLGEWGGSSQFAVVFYAGSMALTGLLSSCVWLYATRGRRLVDDDIDPRLVSLFLLRSPAVALIFLISILISFASIDVAKYSWLLIAVSRPVLTRIHFPTNPDSPWWRRPLR